MPVLSLERKCMSIPLNGLFPIAFGCALAGIVSPFHETRAL
jgi:hypothetical protein